ncbi:MAG: hypothetical protein ACE5DZ_04860 [Mariprofundus sp.]
MLLLAIPAPSAMAFEHFVSRNGNSLLDGNKTFRFVSVNIPNYFILEDRAGTDGEKWHRVTAFEQRDAARAVNRLGGQVFRSYTFSVEGGKNLSGDLAHIYADQHGRIRYNEELFRDMDRGLAIAAEEGVRVIVPLVDNWAWFGGFAEWAALSGVKDFWNEPKAKSDFNGASDSLHYPGFPSTKPADEAAIIRILKEAAFAIRNMPVASEAVPEAPVLLSMQSPESINWQGSSGAVSYDIQRRKGNDGTWKTIATDISDAIPVEYHGEIISKLPLFSDHPAAGLWSYRIIAKNNRGISSPSNTVKVIAK